jgi:Uma2 family endonuclease
MPLLKDYYTAEDYWNLPEGERAELIDGKFYDMAPPSRIHQKLVFTISRIIGNYIADHHGSCEVYPAPFAVNLDADDKDWVEPDISVICDPDKLTDRGCSGAPDLIFEIVSPSSRKLDYGIKNGIYSQSGVREYWIVDPAKERVTVYHYEDDAAPVIYSFVQDIPVGIYPGLTIKINDLLENY